MKIFKIALTRTYLVTIKAEDADKAKQFSEYFIGDCLDFTDEKVQIENNFSFEDIEMVYNEAQKI